MLAPAIIRRSPSIILRRGPIFDHSFLGGEMGGMSLYRPSGATSGRYTDAPGSGYTSYGAMVPRFEPGLGLILETARSNHFLDSDAPVTQSKAFSTGTFVVWMIGSGSVTTSVSVGSATGLGVATQGNPNIFTLTSPSTVVLTVEGSVERVQWETGTEPTTYIVSTTSAGVRQGESSTGSLYTPFPAALACTVIPMEAQESVGTAGMIANVMTSSGNPRLGAQWPGSGAKVAVAHWGSSPLVLLGGPGEFLTGVPHLIVASFDGSRLSRSADNNSVTFSRAGSSVTGRPFLVLNSLSPNGAGGLARMIVQRVRVWDRGLFPAEMQGLQP